MRKKELNIRRLVTVILAVSFTFFGVRHFAAQEYGGKDMMNRTEMTMNKDFPEVDMNGPSTFRTATFSLG